MVPIIVGALLHCSVSKACPDPSITEYAKDQQIVLLSLVGLGTLALVLRIFDKACPRPIEAPTISYERV